MTRCLTYSDICGCGNPMTAADAGILACMPLPVSGTYSRSAQFLSMYSVCEHGGFQS